MIASVTPEKIVVIGGGYAGTIAANRLLQRDDVHVSLVNPRPEFVERIRLHQLAAGTGDAVIDYGTLLGEDVELVVDSAERIDADARTVHLASGRALDYDHLVYAVGSTGATPASVPGAAEFAYDIAELEPARRLRGELQALPQTAPITVVGGGLTGIEIAAELAEQGRTVTVVCGRTLAPYLSEPGRRYVAKWLNRNGVTVIEGDNVTEVQAEAVVLNSGTERPSALTIWTAGFAVPGLAAASGLRTDELGRLITDETLTSLDDERIVAAGDCAAPSGRALRMSGYAAGPLGALAADTVLARIAGTEPPVIDLAFTGACVSLGRRDGIRQLGRKDDSTVDFFIRGRLGAFIKEMTCRFVIAKRIRLESRKPGAMIWIKGGPRAVAPKEASARTA
ncbi:MULTISPECIES: NAD(P)/FAD-dependent oxidoreductase [Glycomyces]|uniref:FAD-dependent oxidoreductase n=2 Tax=Glycomyces TaxID=58113 RepID=A0A9X3SYC2_9ACTN|nr:FAD-dependent oxidoreductase [Glycomyces lechevalierae]MDA1387917.1 FAD-dependent oxidoreductase [Glycomyces lechevalierae]MDR7336585.1 NADH dehydrogenase [Glycomyces lechevalierae]